MKGNTMKASDAKTIADKYNAGEEGFNKKLYDSTVAQIKRAASTGKYSTFITLDSKSYEAKAIAAKLKKDGFKVKYEWCPSEIGVCGVRNSYASLNISWR